MNNEVLWVATKRDLEVLWTFWSSSIRRKQVKSQDVVNLIGDLYFRNKLREVEAVRHVEAVTRARGQHLPLQRGPGLQALQLSLW